MEMMTAPAAPPPMPVLPRLTGPVETSPPAIQSSDLLLSPSARKLRAIEMRLGQHIVSLAQDSLFAAQIQKLLEERRNRRRGIEVEILEGLHRYNGEYSGTLRARLGAQQNRSQLWVDLTRMKCDAAHADLMDVLRGPAGDKPWGLEPEKVPENYPIPDVLVAMGVTLDQIREEHKRRTRAMDDEIDSQLGIADFDEKLDEVVHEGIVTGTGVLFGPFTVPDKEMSWEMVFDANMKGVVKSKKTGAFRPWVRHVPVLNYYPDMESPDAADSSPIEILPMSRRQFLALASQPHINPAAVLRVLKERPYGNYTPASEVMEARRIGLDNRPSESNRYEVILYYGEVTGEELRAAGADVADEDLTLSVTGEFWICENYILRARKHEGPNPYHVFKYRKRGGNSPFGKGMPILVKGSQDAINGAARMIMDNAAIASGPIIEINTMLMRMEPGVDPTDIHGWKVYMSSHDGHSGKRALFIHQIPAYTEVFMRIMDKFHAIMDEESGQPSLTGGQQGVGTTKTATGMSILNSNANKIRNHVLRAIDDGVLEPLIEAMFDWNMRFSLKNDILSPAKAIAKGVANLMSREIESQRLLSMMQIFMGHPAFKDDVGMKQLLRSLGLPVDELVHTEEDALRNTMQQQLMEGMQGGEGRPLASRAESVAQGPMPPPPGAPPVGMGAGMAA